MRRWAAGIAGTVVSGLIMALLLGIASNTVEQLKAQTRTAEQIRTLALQMRDLRTQIDTMGDVTDRVSRVEVHQADIERRVHVLEGRDRGK